jgi:Cu(I)-responsive transcriptional regulator
MIRYYESIGLIPSPARTQSGYRDYGTHDVHRLKFVRRARELGFDMDRIRDLLRLWSDRNIGNAEVRRVANAHIESLAAQASRLQEMITTLRHLVKSCRGESRAECPIMADLSGGVNREPFHHSIATRRTPSVNRATSVAQGSIAFGKSRRPL